MIFTSETEPRSVRPRDSDFRPVVGLAPQAPSAFAWGFFLALYLARCLLAFMHSSAASRGNLTAASMLASRYAVGMRPRLRLPAGFIEPCIPTRAAKPPVGPDWVHEIKHDGYRLIVRRDGDTVRLFTRRGYEWSNRYPAIARAAAKLRAKSFTIDGEAAVCGSDGVAIFDALHRRGTVTEAMLYTFDLLDLDGEDLRSGPLGERKARLAKLLARKPVAIVFNEHTDEDGATVFRHACKLGLEGIVSKRLSAPYRSGPSRDWIKVKNADGPAMRRHRGETW